MIVYVVRESYYGEIIGVFSDSKIVDDLRLGYDLEIEEFDLDELSVNWVPRFAQYKRERDCQEEMPPPSLGDLHDKIKHSLSQLIMAYNRGDDFSARKYSRQLVKQLDIGKSLGYNMEPIESYVDQQLKDNHQFSLSQQDFDIQRTMLKLNYQRENKNE